MDGLTASCKGCLREYDKRRGYHGRPGATKIWRKANKKKYAAHNAVNNAIRDGRMDRGEKCEVCGCFEKLHAHHDNYNNPLIVRWLCATHHKQWHHAHGEGVNA
jgi:hypothetical protein